MGTRFDTGAKIKLDILGGQHVATVQTGVDDDGIPSGVLLTFTIPTDPRDPKLFPEIPGVSVFLTAEQIVLFSDMLGMDDRDWEE